jgi:disulfide bond formation protein DsbB
MSRRLLIVLATLGSVALLGGALAFQYLGGLAPCHLCRLQRWPHRVDIVLGAVALLMPGLREQRLLAFAGGLGMIGSTLLGLYHTGVEKHWWLGPTTCTSGDISSAKATDLLNQIMTAPVEHCDQVAWEMWGISMASWNMLISAVLVAVWFTAAFKRDASR